MSGDRMASTPVCSSKFLSQAHMTPPKISKNGGRLMGKSREQKEIDRLTAIYKNLPQNQFAVAQGLIVQAARLRVSLDDLWKDIKKNGRTEMFSQSENAQPYQRERPAAKLFTATDKNYQAIMKQLNDICPPSAKESKLKAMMDDE